MNTVNDIVGGANLYGGVKYAFSDASICQRLLAANLSSGYFKVPQGVYFSGDFTIVASVFFKTYENFGRVIDFGNGSLSDNVVLSLDATNPRLVGIIYKGRSPSYIYSPMSSIQLNKWYHVAFTLQGTQGSLYINGVLVSQATLNVPRNVIRYKNYIGKSNWGGDSYANAIYSGIQIYQIALSPFKVFDEYLRCNF